MSQETNNLEGQERQKSPNSNFSRRGFLNAAGLGAAGLAVGSLLQACGSQAPAPAPTAPPASVPTTAPAPAPTTAPASAPTSAPTTSAAKAPTTAPAATPAKVTPVSELEGVVAPMAARGELPEGTVVVAMASGPEADVHKRLAPEWEKYTKGKSKVAVEDIGRGAAANTKMTVTLTAKSDAWDVLYTFSLGAVANITAGFLEPLGPILAKPNLVNAKAYDVEDFPEAVRKMYSYKNEMYAMSQQFSTMLLYYRKDLLDKYGLPHPKDSGYTWEELRDTCLQLKIKLKEDGQPADVFPLVFGVKKGSHAALNCQQALWSNGVEWFDESKQMPTFNQPKSVEAMRFVMDLLQKDKIASEGIKDWEYAEVLTAYQQGKAVLAIQWDAMAATVEDKEKSAVTAGKNGYVRYPTFKQKDSSFPAGYFHGQGLGISTYSKKKDAAAEYVVWFTSKAIARDTAVKGGGSSGRTSVLTDPEILKATPGHLKVLSDTLVSGHRPYETPALQWIRDVPLGTHMNAAWTGLKTLEQALKDADEEIIAEYRTKGWLK